MAYIQLDRESCIPVRYCLFITALTVDKTVSLSAKYIIPALTLSAARQLVSFVALARACERVSHYQCTHARAQYVERGGGWVSDPERPVYIRDRSGQR